VTGGSLTTIGVTLADNGQLGVDEFSPFSHAAVSLGSSVIAGNGRGCVTNSPPTDAGFNVESDNSCGLGPKSVTGVGDAAVGLGALAANGSDGPQTQAIGTGSAAFLAVPVSSGRCPKTDERGLPRPGAGTAACDAGAYELQRAAATLTQGSPTSGTVTAGSAFAGQLAGTVTDPAGDTGSWSFTLAVTSPGPARADLSLTLAAPAQVHPGAPAAITLTVRNAGPSAAGRTGTALLIPRGWTVTSPGGGTLIGRQLLTFTATSVPAKGSVTYTVILTAPAAKSLVLLPAATASVTADPSYRNNAALALTRVR
jgi:Domain of unknown function DUF11